MIDHLEQLINRFVAVFLRPLVNITIVSLFVYWVTDASSSLIGILSGKDMQGVIAPFLSNLIQGEFDGAVKFAQEHVKELQSASFFLLSTVSIFVILFVYLFDRLVFGFGYLVPVTFKFDLDVYAKLNRNDRRIKWLQDMIKPMPDFAFAYGGIRAYLGEKNGDQNRLVIRSKLVNAIRRIKIVTLYAKSYLFLFICLFVAALWSNTHVLPMRALAITVVLFIVLLASFLLYSYFWKKLVEYDVDSFLWDRCYKGDQTVKGLVPPEASSTVASDKRSYRERIRKQLSKWRRVDKSVAWLEEFLSRSCLKIALFEDVKA